MIALSSGCSRTTAGRSARWVNKQPPGYEMTAATQSFRAQRGTSRLQVGGVVAYKNGHYTRRPSLTTISGVSDTLTSADIALSRHTQNPNRVNRLCSQTHLGCSNIHIHGLHMTHLAAGTPGASSLELLGLSDPSFDNRLSCRTSVLILFLCELACSLLYVHSP